MAMTAAHKDRLACQKPDICGSINDGRLSVLLNKLRAAKVLVDADVRQINQPNQTTYDKVSQLVDSIAHGPDKNYAEFVRVLRDPELGLDYVADTLDDGHGTAAAAPSAAPTAAPPVQSQGATGQYLITILTSVFQSWYYAWIVLIGKKTSKCTYISVGLIFRYI